MTSESGGPAAVDEQKGLMQALVQQLQASAQGGGLDMPKPRVQFSPQEMEEKGYDMRQGANKKDEIGLAMGNFGTMVSNMVAQHKQHQVRDAMNEWDGFHNALQKAQTLAGDPSSPDYKQKVHQMLEQDPWVKTNLDPANPKSVKRLKNMYKALNVDLLAEDKENVHREGLKKMFQVKEAYQKAKSASKQMLDYKKRQAQGGGQQPQPQPQQGGQPGQAGPQAPQGMDPAQHEAQMRQAVDRLIERSTVTPADNKMKIEVAKLLSEDASRRATQARQDLDKWEWHVDSDGHPYALDKTNPKKAPIYPPKAEGKEGDITDSKAWTRTRLEQNASQFKQTLEFKKWKEELDVKTKKQIAQLTQGKPSQSLQPVAVFSRTGLHQMEMALDIIDDLASKGVLGSALNNKVEDAIFGKGLVDPTLPTDVRKQIGKVRAAFAYTSSAAMRAHTGRTSREIYDDFKNTLKIGQDLDALRGAAEATRDMLTEYSDVLTPQSQKALREPVQSKAKPKPKITDLEQFKRKPAGVQ